MTAKCLATAALLFVCTAIAPAAEQASLPSSAPDPELVYLDVSVADAAGRPIGGLAATDFEVLAGGQPVAIHSVTEVTPRTGAARSRPAGDPVPGLMAPADVSFDVSRNDEAIDRHIAIVLDDMVRPGAQAGANSWIVTDGLDLARAFIDRLGPDDRGTIYFGFMGRQQGLTASRERLRAAVAAFVRRPIRPEDCPASGSLDGCVLDTLHRVADALPIEPARRAAVVFISDNMGLPAVDLPRDGAGAGTPSQSTLQALQAAHAVVYSITPAGVSPGGASAGVSLAEATGGRALVDSTLEATVDTIVGDLDAHYVLAFRPAADDGSFHDLAVRVSRTGAAVRTRPGVFVPGGPAPVPPAGATTPLEAAMVSPRQVRGVPLGMTAAAFAVPGRREAVVSIASAVTAAAPDGAAAWRAEVAATAFDPQWRPHASYRQTIEVSTQPGAGPQTVDVLSAIELIPGRYEIRVAAQTGARAGSVFADIEVPEFLNLLVSASGLVVSTVPEPYAASRMLAETVPVTPSTRRLFRQDESAEVFVRFYQGGRSRVRNMPVSLRIADATGTGIIQGAETIPPSQFDRDRATDWRFSLPLDRLQPGEYLLTVGARIDDVAVTRNLRFGVVR